VFAGSKNRYNYDTFYKAFQPRFGFAYSAGRGFVIRGGYGIYFSQPRSGAAVRTMGYQGYDEQTPWISTFQNQPFLPGSRLSDPFRSFQAPYPDLGPKAPVGSSLGVLNDVGFGATGPSRASASTSLTNRRGALEYRRSCLPRSWHKWIMSGKRARIFTSADSGT